MPVVLHVWGLAGLPCAWPGQRAAARSYLETWRQHLWPSRRSGRSHQVPPCAQPAPSALPAWELGPEPAAQGIPDAASLIPGFSEAPEQEPTRKPHPSRWWAWGAASRLRRQVLQGCCGGQWTGPLLRPGLPELRPQCRWHVSLYTGRDPCLRGKGCQAGRVGSGGGWGVLSRGPGHWSPRSKPSIAHLPVALAF